MATFLDRKIKFKVVWWTVWILLMATDIASGALRYYLTQAGYSWLFYVPKAFILILCVVSIMSFRQNIVILCASLTLGFFSFVGYLNGLPILQVLFEINVFLPLFFGAFFWPYLKDNPEAFVKLALLGLAVIFIGLVWNVLGHPPWVGFSYQMGNTDIEASREWTTFGIMRPSGFGRISSQTAAEILVLSVSIYPFIAERWSKTGLAMLLVSLGFIVLTTNKAAVAALLVVMFLIYFPFRRVARYSFVTAAVVSILAPAISELLAPLINYNSFLGNLVFLSLETRFTSGWPYWLKYIVQYSIPGLGIGLGGIGGGFAYFGRNLGLPVTDSFSLYMYGNLGIVGIAFLVFLIWIAVRLIRSSDPLYRGMGLGLAAIFIWGFGTDAMEATIAATFIGLGLRAGAEIIFTEKSLVSKRLVLRHRFSLEGDT